MNKHASKMNHIICVSALCHTASEGFPHVEHLTFLTQCRKKRLPFYNN